MADLTGANLMHLDLTTAYLKELEDPRKILNDEFIASMTSKSERTDPGSHGEEDPRKLRLAKLTAKLNSPEFIAHEEAKAFASYRPSTIKLTSANLSGAKLSGQELTNANLKDSNLTFADLTGAKLNGADLSGADLTGANLEGADLTGTLMG